MATIFLPSGRQSYSAQIRIWDEKKGGLVWKKISTRTRDADAALGIANALERASGAARQGTMTRAAAEELVNGILEIANVPFRVGVPSLKTFTESLLDGRAQNVGEKTAGKYLAHWSRLKSWAGGKVEWPLDHWTSTHLSEYYGVLINEVSSGTANDHMRTLVMIFASAVAAGHIKGNPAKLVEKRRRDTVEKVTFTRRETARMLTTMRAGGRRDWCALTLAGWHTGHRIQDLLSIVKDDLEDRPNVGWCVKIQPDKKEHQGGRTVILPIPRFLALMMRRLKGFQSIGNADNYNGRISNQFVEWLVRSGIDPLPVQKTKRVVHLKSFHSFRHSMTTRLTSAGVSGELARLVTDHDSEKVQKAYTHAEIEALADALKKARRKRL